MISREESFFWRSKSTISTARKKQISELDGRDGQVELGFALGEGDKSPGEALKNGVTAAETAALVPSLRASRRDILLVMQANLPMAEEYSKLRADQ
jgi:hypothetical protein